MKTGLSALIHPRSTTEFFEHYHQGQPFVVHDHSETIAELTSLPFLASLDALLKSWPLPFEVRLPDIRDEAGAIDTTAKDAQKLFTSGMGLLFSDASLISPVLQDWLN